MILELAHFRILPGSNNTVEDHMQGFRESPRFGEWRALLQPFFTVPPSAAHYQLVFANRIAS